MKRSAKNLVLCVMIVGFMSVACFGQTAESKKTEVTEAQKAEKAEQKKATISACDEYLNRLIGTWTAEYVENGKKVKTGLTFKRAVQDQFLQGYWTTTDETGAIVFEQLLILTFNKGGLRYLMNAYESTGWAKSFIGQATTDKVLLQGMLPTGFEHFQWKILEDGSLERAHWNPVQGKVLVEGDPDETIIFKPVTAK